jgi:deoxyhypusine synthase
VEEDFIKCMGKTYLGSFSTPGAALRAKGMNRIGNLIVPNDNYCHFEDWIMPILDTMLEEQEASKTAEEPLHWTPSKIIARLGKVINDESSVYYWAYKNDIPVFCPALTDGSLGDMLYFHTFKSSPQQLRVDIVEDIRRINTMAVRAKRTGMIILGGGVVKHHIANANLMRNGAESAVYINTGQEFDGSDAGARPDEAVSWGKIKADAASVKVCSPLWRRSLLRLGLLILLCRSTQRRLWLFHSSWPRHLPRWMSLRSRLVDAPLYEVWMPVLTELIFDMACVALNAAEWPQETRMARFLTVA